jgi:septum formation protein
LANAVRKARAVSKRFPGGWVLAADTMIEFSGRLYGKPRDRRQAIGWMTRLTGKVHRLATGVVLRKDRVEIRRVVLTRVKLRALDRAELGRVLRRPDQLAGGYAIRRGRDPLVERIWGSFTNVVGLPMETVLPLLRRLHV